MQKQPDKITVQGSIENALKRLNINSDVLHAGRTDRGVHALNQVVSFKLPSFWNQNKLLTELNKILHPNIHIKKFYNVNDDFNPRFDAKKRSYRYILNPNFNPFSANYTTYYPHKINISLLKKALKEFEGIHDFEYFAKTGSDVNNYIREIYKTDVYKYKNFTVIKIVGNGFLRAQIRLIVDFVLKINENKLTVQDLQKQLSKQELISKHLAPPNGLYLDRIWY
ncbi:tRNA pseudouridine synthase A [Nautilia profundicola AmH]|uniref:tRNA pseudouridine synthase A n=2 Tax=Nautilia TaxID=191291 RepID=B9LAA7_NAUPA|nr:tRNA pseudouridine(38-40) synthase TruA [Nautilia profundicola]ACM92677.1 tRNA pseudouridine synthase A [Nautilia profundicola AmH]